MGQFRVKAVHVREAAYQSILSGATMGINYGANGILAMVYPKKCWFPLSKTWT